MTEALTFCPVCYCHVSIDEVRCPHCGISLKEWQRRSYTEKLIPALHHPLADVRMRVIITLGLQRARQAQEALVECALRHPSDIVEGLEIVNSLRLIAAAGSGPTALRRLADLYPSRPVRCAAREAIEKLNSTGSTT